MKIALCSDLHLEFGSISLENTENAEVLILSGDILVAADLNELGDSTGLIVNGRNKSETYHKFFQECSERFPNVIYIMGNHEYYHGDFATSLDIIRQRLSYLENVFIMERQTMVIEDITFIAGTLWTDMNKEDPLTLQHIRGYMNDYRIIENSNEVVNYKAPVYKKDENGEYITQKIGEINSLIEDGFEFKTRPAKFTPELSVVEHKLMLDTIKATVESNASNKYVVIGHHAPSKLSTKPRYQKDVLVNGAYSSDLSEFILDHPQIKVWTHGHTHDVFDYMIGGTRIICNPRGYDAYEDRADNFELLFFEV
jgi:predicted phosphodiesterase